MNDPGTAYNLFVRVDHNPGDSGGVPQSYSFELCNHNNNTGTTCGVVCTIVDPNTTCQDLMSKTGHSQGYNAGDLMMLFPASSASAHATDVTWSVTYQHKTFTPPGP